MRREELATLGIQLPVLPTIVLGALPGPPDWAPRLERLGLDVVSSGAAADTPETLANARAAVPHRPLKAAGPIAGARIVECVEPAPPGAYRIDAADGVLVVDGAGAGEGPDEIASRVLAAVRDDPSAWWVAAGGLGGASPEVVEGRLGVVVEAVRRVRLFLAKQQFD